MAQAEHSHDWFLRADTKIQPLFCRWPAWPHLIAPAQAAMNIAFHYLPSLQSFLENPSIHISAANHPAMFGGPFVALTSKDIPQVSELIASTQRKCGALLEFAQQFRKLDERLQREAKGYRLDDFYRDLPPSLRGLVELVYDLNNHPTVKLFEALLYDDALDTRHCWELCLHRARDIDRPFFMSTPLLDAPDRLFINLPLQDLAVDELAQMRIRPGSFLETARRLGLDGASTARFGELFTRDPPDRNDPRYRGK